ncbi:translation initiation factor IF-2-like [Molothrus ater]|uniref:translation initiation factor IF-2-like n=1 Tax=Molothrus ater TaxID=84834 RepID=UPI0023E79C5C|nr:translation initiation factor IF-2-like [Molothrus ater]
MAISKSAFSYKPATRNATPGCWRQGEVRGCLCRSSRGTQPGHRPPPGLRLCHRGGQGVLHGSAAARFNHDAELQEKRAGTHRARHPPQRPSRLTQPAGSGEAQLTSPGAAGNVAGEKLRYGPTGSSIPGGCGDEARRPAGRTLQPVPGQTAGGNGLPIPARHRRPRGAGSRGARAGEAAAPRRAAPAAGPAPRAPRGRADSPRPGAAPGGRSAGSIAAPSLPPRLLRAAAPRTSRPPRPGRAAAAAQGRCGEGRSRPPPRRGGAAQRPATPPRGPRCGPARAGPPCAGRSRLPGPRLCWDTAGPWA